ncbi:MAG TPA: 4Fe-4S binding protein [Candidatus Aphodomonas merdavium]|nr:4Fe-4S binding protein [Candidatus Aphodomonas merdavium]
METVKRKRRKARVNRTLCVACGCCVKVCPLQAVTVFRGLYAKVEESKCVGCGKCARECPASVIEIQEVVE